MSGPNDRTDESADQLPDLAAPYALDAVSPAERDQLRRRRVAATAATREDFDQQVRSVRATMAQISAVTAAAPPASLRERVLDRAASASAPFAPSGSADNTQADVGDPPHRGAGTASSEGSDSVPGVTSLADARTATSRRRGERPTRHSTPRKKMYAAAAAVAAVVVGAVGWGIGRSTTEAPPAPPTAAQVLSAKDIQTHSVPMGSGHATIAFSAAADAGVLVMNDVAPPQTGSVYQMWMIGHSGATSAGMMGPADITGSHTAVISHLDGATSLRFTVEPAGGSPSPTGPLVGDLSLR